MNPKIMVLAIISLAVAISTVFALTLNATPAQITPTPDAPALESYTGKLQSGISLFHNGEAIAELTFEDGAVFVCSEQMAKEANLAIGETYLIHFDAAQPNIVIEIIKAGW